LSVLGYGTDNDENFKKFWPCNIHFVGRDISRFHCIIWPILLKMLDLPLPKQIHSHGFITLKGDKISKSKSNGFNPVSLVERYGADALRYYLAKEGPIFNDIPYTSEQFVNTINSDLCNDLGNLVSRTLAMITQYNGKIVPEPKVKDEEELNLENACNELLDKCNKYLEDQKINEALNSIFNVISYANKYIDITEPWKLAKDESKKDKLDTVLYYLSETIRICTTLLQAYLVEIPAKIFEKFNIEKNLQTFESIEKFSYDNFGREVNKGENLFPRLDVYKEIEFLDTANTPVKEEKEEKKVEEKETKEIKETENIDKVNTVSYINYDDFAKVKLITGKVINSEKVENADKLLKNTIEMGNEIRTIVSGIAKYYTPEEIIGKTVVVVSNLAPRKLRGIESQGMLLCGVDEEKDIVSLVTLDKPLPSGKEVC
jgi:methionyl-tRNA synthetase